jgi:hypothetical protein
MPLVDEIYVIEPIAIWLVLIMVCLLLIVAYVVLFIPKTQIIGTRYNMMNFQCANCWRPDTVYNSVVSQTYPEVMAFSFNENILSFPQVTVNLWTNIAFLNVEVTMFRGVNTTRDVQAYLKLGKDRKTLTVVFGQPNTPMVAVLDQPLSLGWHMFTFQSVMDVTMGLQRGQIIVDNSEPINLPFSQLPYHSELRDFSLGINTEGVQGIRWYTGKQNPGSYLLSMRDNLLLWNSGQGTDKIVLLRNIERAWFKGFGNTGTSLIPNIVTTNPIATDIATNTAVNWKSGIIKETSTVPGTFTTILDPSQFGFINIHNTRPPKEIIIHFSIQTRTVTTPDNTNDDVKLLVRIGVDSPESTLEWDIEQQVHAFNDEMTAIIPIDNQITTNKMLIHIQNVSPVFVVRIHDVLISY